MNYPRFHPGDEVLVQKKIKPRTVLMSKQVAGTYSYLLQAPDGTKEEAYETQLRRTSV